MRGGQRVVLPGPNILQLFAGNGEEHAVRVHLRGVRQQSLIALLKVLVNQDAGRSLVARRLPRRCAVRDVLNPAAQQALTVRIEQMLVQGEGAFGVERAVVVELQRGPGLPLTHVGFRVACLLECLHGNLVGHDVVGVRVTANLVISDDDVRTVLTHQTHERRGGTVQGHGAKATEGQRRHGVALGQTGVEEANPAVLNTHNLASSRHFSAAQTRQVTVRTRVLSDSLVQDVTALAAGHRRHHEAGTTGNIRRSGTGTFGGLVVRVRVHREDAQTGVVLIQRFEGVHGRVSRQVCLQLFNGFAHGGLL